MHTVEHCKYVIFLLQLKFDSLEFPAVTFCNLNQFRADKADRDAHVRELMDTLLETMQEDLYGGEDEYETFKSKPQMEDIF